MRGRLESEIFADFFLLSMTGESRADATTPSHRVLVLTERMTNMIGAVSVSSNVAQTRTEIVRWLREFGLESGSTSVVLVPGGPSPVLISA